MFSRKLFAVILLAVAPVLGSVARGEAERDIFDEAPWSFSVGGAGIWYEGNEPVNPSVGLGAKLGYDFNQYFSVEGGLDLLPYMDATEQGEAAGIGSSTWGAAISLDGMAHLRNAKDLRWDPYLSIGAYSIYYGDDFGESRPEFALNAGVGLFYHFDNVWALRADYRTAVVGADTEFNQVAFLGVNCRWDATVKSAFSVSGGQLDSDGDGLLDSREAEIGTDPYNPDTDGDGLSDGQEVNGVDLNGRLITTNPLKADTDMDALKDGPEVLTYKTDPTDPDTDKGGVRDGHEVIEDNTNPLDPSDDLQLFTLNIEFDYDKADLRQEYFSKLDVVVKVLQRDGNATARVEGHADKRKRSEREYNLKLSDRRANAVMKYLVDVGGIAASRLTAKGYGFDRPVAANDTEANMQKNRRTEIYIRKGGAAEAVSTVAPMALPTDAAPATPATPPVK